MRRTSLAISPASGTRLNLKHTKLHTGVPAMVIAGVKCVVIIKSGNQRVDNNLLCSISRIQSVIVAKRYSLCCPRYSTRTRRCCPDKLYGNCGGIPKVRRRDCYCDKLLCGGVKVKHRNDNLVGCTFIRSTSCSIGRCRGHGRSGNVEGTFGVSGIDLDIASCG